MNPRTHVGDGKLPNHYWVFQDETKFKKVDGCIEIYKEEDTKGSFLGEFKTYKEALSCVDDKAYSPHVTIEDRLSGQVFEQICIVCPCCGKEEYKSFQDYKYTKEEMEKRGKVFV